MLAGLVCIVESDALGSSLEANFLMQGYLGKFWHLQVDRIWSFYNGTLLASHEDASARLCAVEPRFWDRTLSARAAAQSWRTYVL